MVPIHRAENTQPGEGKRNLNQTVKQSILEIDLSICGIEAKESQRRRVLREGQWYHVPLSASDEVREVTNAFDTREVACDLEKSGRDGNQIGVS